MRLIGKARGLRDVGRRLAATQSRGGLLHAGLADIILRRHDERAAEAAGLSAALTNITDLDMRTHFDPQVMEDFDVAGILWTEEEPDVLDAILIPIFNNLKALYDRAARAGQYVLVVHS